MSKNIHVPPQHRHLMREERNTPMREADIKLLIESRPGLPITTGDFVKATGVTSAMVHVRRLMKAGYITRRKVKRPGHRSGYGYKWHAEPLTPKDAILKSGGVVTRTLGLPPLLMTDTELENLNGIFHDWIDDPDQQPTGDEIVHVRAFIAYIREQNGSIKAKREEKIKEAGK